MERSLGDEQGADLAREEFEHAQRFVWRREVPDAHVRRLVAWPTPPGRLANQIASALEPHTLPANVTLIRPVSLYGTASFLGRLEEEIPAKWLERFSGSQQLQGHSSRPNLCSREAVAAALRQNTDHLICSDNQKQWMREQTSRCSVLSSNRHPLAGRRPTPQRGGSTH